MPTRALSWEGGTYGGAGNIFQTDPSATLQMGLVPNPGVGGGARNDHSHRRDL